MTHLTPGTVLTVADVAATIDHALLKPDLTPREVEQGCRETAELGAFSVCVRPRDIRLAVDAIASVPGSPTVVCTVIGFPHGTTSTEAKVAESRQALADGARELDMVLPVGWLLGGELDAVRADIAAVVEVGHSQGALVKVILETTLLTDDAKRAGCVAAEAAGADFVKTSTGFAGGGATYADIALMRAAVSDRVAVKASGGVRDIDTALGMYAEGATRLGTSSTAAILAGARELEAAGRLVVPEPGTGLGTGGTTSASY